MFDVWRGFRIVFLIRVFFFLLINLSGVVVGVIKIYSEYWGLIDIFFNLV